MTDEPESNAPEKLTIGQRVRFEVGTDHRTGKTRRSPGADRGAIDGGPPAS